MNEIWLDPKVVAMAEGSVRPFGVSFTGATSLASPVSTVYKDGQDYSTAVQLSGDSDAVSGNVMTLKKITALPGDAGDEYVVSVQVEVDGSKTDVRKFIIQVVSKSDES